MALVAAHAYAGNAQLVLYADFPDEPPPSVTEELHEEVAAVMASAGLDVQWRPLSSSKYGETVSDLAVVHFHGRCVADAEFARSFVSGALGWTHVSEGIVLPFAEVDCDRVRSLLAEPLLSVPPQLRCKFFGRALARVVAHELYHMYSGVHHGSAGVAKSTYSATDLMTEQFRLNEHDIHAMCGKARGTRACSQ